MRRIFRLGAAAALVMAIVTPAVAQSSPPAGSRDGNTPARQAPQTQLAAAFEKLIHDEDLRRQLGAAGREWARRNCWKQSAEALFGALGSAA